MSDGAKWSNDGVPTPAYIEQVLPELFHHYKVRNEVIANARAHVAGEHTIEKPAATRYDVKTLHSWAFRAFVSERHARFLPIPRIRVIPPGTTDTALGKASEMEKAINALFYWLRRYNDDWRTTVADVIMVDGGCLRVEMNANAAWPKLAVNEGLNDDGEPYDDDEDHITRGMPTGSEEEDGEKVEEEERNSRIKKANDARSNAREEYKRKQGVNGLVSMTYVPYEAFFPFPDSDISEEFIEIEFRSVRKILANDRFAPDVREDIRKQVADDVKYASVNAQMPIIRYSSKTHYAYYLVDKIDSLEANETTRLARFIKDEKNIQGLRLLYSYEHGADMPLYAHIIGQHGGWVSGNTDYVKGRINALLETEGKIDELLSQALSNVRETFWPTLKIKLDMARPPESANDGDPQKITPHGTGDLELYTNEDVEPLFQARTNPVYVDLMDRLMQTMAKIGGAPGLYGIHQPGVEGGFQESQLLQQADSQYAAIESNIVTGAQNVVLIFLSLFRASNEKVWVRARSKKAGRPEYFEELSIDPDNLNPIPEIDAVVKARSSGDEAVRLRNYITATTDVGGIPGTAPYDRATGRQELLDIEQPDDMDVMVKKQTIIDQLWPEIVAAEVKKRYSLFTVEEIAAQNQEQDLAAVMQNDPELAAQMGMLTNGQAPPDPSVAAAPPVAGTPVSQQGVGGGLEVGMAQPEATMGRIDQMMAAPVAPLP